MTDAAVLRLTPVVLSASLGIRRDAIGAPGDRPHDHDARYDAHTLIYDAVWSERDGAVLLYCPKLMNLEAALTRGAVRIDGRPVQSARFRRFRRYDIAPFPAKTKPERLSVEWEGWRADIPVAAEDAAFAGRNCLFTLSKDNDLNWIRDWARFHVRLHGANAALFFDNGSTAYTPEDVAAALASVEGLDVIRVVEVDRPYGPLLTGAKRSKGLFLQSAVLNLARLRFLAPARAVLQNDVDELVVSHSGRSVFDAAVASRCGFVKFRGLWRLPEQGRAAAPRHSDHSGLPANKGPCPAKYCIVPSGRLRRHSWNVHNLDRVFLSRRFDTGEFTYLHCRGISTGWKSANSRQPVPTAGVDTAARDLFTAVF